MKKKKEKTILDKIKLDLRKIILCSIVLNSLFLICGVVIYMNPYITASIVGIIMGISLMIFGIFAVYEFLLKSISPIFTYKIFIGILAIILGIFVIINPFKLIKVLTLTLGIYLVISSIFKFCESIKLKKYGYDGWLIMLVTSIILLTFGIFVIINPMASMDIVQVAAIFIILSSILEIANLLMIYNKAKDLIKLFKKASK